MPEFLKCWIRIGEKDLSQLELYIPLPITEEILIGFIMAIIGFLFGIGMSFGGVAALKKNKTVGIWILKTGILIRDVPKQVEYYKWEQLEEAIIENGYVTQTNSPSRHYSVKMLRIDFKVNQIHRLRFKGERGSKIVEPTNDLINLLAYDITSPNVSLKKLFKACEKFIPIKDNKENI